MLAKVGCWTPWKGKRTVNVQEAAVEVVRQVEVLAGVGVGVAAGAIGLGVEVEAEVGVGLLRTLVHGMSLAAPQDHVVALLHLAEVAAALQLMATRVASVRVVVASLLTVWRQVPIDRHVSI